MRSSRRPSPLAPAHRLVAAAALSAAGCGALLGIDDVSPLDGAGGAGAAGGGAGGAGAGETSLARFANLFTDDDLAAARAFDFCSRPAAGGPWFGPFLTTVRGAPLRFAQVTDHVPLPAGAYDVRAVAGATPSCDAPEARPELTLAGAQLAPNDYQTFAVVGDEQGRARLVAYRDGRPAQGPAVVEFALSHAVARTAGNVRFEPGGVDLAPRRGVRLPPLLAGMRSLDALYFGGARYRPASQVPFVNGLGYSLFAVAGSLLSQAADVRAIVCVNNARDLLPVSPRPSEQCVSIPFEFVEIE